MSIWTELGWVGRIAVPQTGFPRGTTLVSVETFVSIVSVLKKTYPFKPQGSPLPYTDRPARPV